MMTLLEVNEGYAEHNFKDHLFTLHRSLFPGTDRNLPVHPTQFTEHSAKFNNTAQQLHNVRSLILSSLLRQIAYPHRNPGKILHLPTDLSHSGKHPISKNPSIAVLSRENSQQQELRTLYSQMLPITTYKTNRRSIIINRKTLRKSKLPYRCFQLTVP